MPKYPVGNIPRSCEVCYVRVGWYAQHTCNEATGLDECEPNYRSRSWSILQRTGLDECEPNYAAPLWRTMHYEQHGYGFVSGYTIECPDMPFAYGSVS